MTTTTKPHSNAAALDAYIAAQHQARALLDTLTAQLDAHQDNVAPDEVHWGHVGDMQRISAGIQETVANED
jgi:hypothetical protein